MRSLSWQRPQDLQPISPTMELPSHGLPWACASPWVVAVMTAMTVTAEHVVPALSWVLVLVLEQGQGPAR